MVAPTSVDQYINWANENINSNFSNQKIRTIYEVNLQSFFNTLAQHQFFNGLPRHLEQWENEYQIEKNSRLFMQEAPPELLLKPYDSAIEKSFRVNILWNENFPDAPKRGWVTSENLYFYFNDLIRSSLVCRFIDGPRFVTDRLMNYAKALGLERRRYSQERDDGYYAYHFYVKFPVTGIDSNWEAEPMHIEAEIQVTTQLQDVLRSLTHNFYKEQRISADIDSSRWKWEFKSNRFRVGYLSHTLHLLESIILETRDDVLRPDLPAKQEGNDDEG